MVDSSVIYSKDERVYVGRDFTIEWYSDPRIAAMMEQQEGASASASARVSQIAALPKPCTA